MPFIGKQPETGAFKLIDSITTSATATYALTVNSAAYFPESARNLIVSLNGVTQAPESAYTVSGSNIVFASALTASDVIDYILVIGDAVDIGTPSDNTVGTDQIASSVDLSGKTLTFANDQISGNIIDGGTISNFASTGIDDNATSTAITIDASENVGIGTASPSFALGGGLHINYAGYSSINLQRGSSVVGHAIDFSDENNTLQYRIGTNFASGGAKLLFAYGSTPTIGMTLDTAGKIGIGTSSPASQLHVQASGGSTGIIQLGTTGGTVAREWKLLTPSSNGYLYIQDVNASSNRVAIDTSGNVGIGETSPGGLLHLKSDDNGIIFQSSSSTNQRAQIFFQNSGGTTTGKIALDPDAANANTMAFSTGSSERMRIDSSGNVGIGITSLVNPLQVSVTSNTASKTSGSAFDGGAVRLDGSLGSANSEVGILGGPNDSLSSGIGFARKDGTTWGTQLRFYTHGTAITTTDELTERMRLDADGNLGIGTTSPDEKLEIYQGNIKLGTDTNTTSKLIFERSAVDRAEIYVGSSNQLQFDLGNTERMRIDSNGNIGIGTSSTSTSHRVTIAGLGGDRTQPLEVLGTGSTQNFNWLISGMQQNLSAGQRAVIFVGKSESTYNSGGMYYYHAGDGSSSNQLRWGLFAADDLMVLSATGNLGIGTTSPLYELSQHISDSGANYHQFTNSTTGTASTDGFLVGIGGDEQATLWNYENTHMRFATNGSERMRIDSSGNLLVGTTSSSVGGAANLHVESSSVVSLKAYRATSTGTSGIANFFSNVGSTGATVAYILANGGFGNYQSNDVNLSDQRVKKDINDSGNYLEKLCNIPVRNFRYNQDEADGKHHLGVIAQEVEAVAPEFVNKASWEHADGPMDTVYNTDLMFAMMKSIQELSTQVNELKAEVAALKGA